MSANKYLLSTVYTQNFLQISSFECLKLEEDKL